MLIMKRMTEPYEVRKCNVSGELIIYGDFYYEDDTDKTVVKYSVYHKLKKEAKDLEFDYTLYNRAQSQKEYREMIKQSEREYLKATILDRPIFDQGHAKSNGME